MTKEIMLTQGKAALIDDEDFDCLNQWKWYALYSQNTNLTWVRAEMSDILKLADALKESEKA